MSYDGRSVMRYWHSGVIKSPYPCVDILGAVIEDGAGGITNGSAILVKCYGAVKIVCKCCDAL